ncbi:MAG TPA: hypothetical protein PLW48_05330 [Alphaproteobacteria bacterium]|nr:hypothetical protein [Rhodospirillaceae bacterium]HRJ66539.1 hypothetical protein [Alphaproteobacteria bacterium]
MKRTLLLPAVLALAVIAGTAFFLTRGEDAPAASSMATAAADTRTPDELLLAARAAFLGDGTAQSDTQGAQLMLKAAAAGSEQAIGYAGTLYMGGIGVEHNVTKAREWLSKSTDEEARALAEALMTFEAVLATMPENEAKLQEAMDAENAHESIRASFIAALEREKLAAAETAAGDNAVGDSAANEDAAPADATAADAAPEMPQPEVAADSDATPDAAAEGEKAAGE